MRSFLCQVLVVCLLTGAQTAAADYGIGRELNRLFKFGAKAIAVTGIAVTVGAFGIRGCVQSRALQRPDFLSLRGGGAAVNHYSHISRYDVEKKDPQVRDYLKLAAKQDIGLTLHVRDSEGNSSIATFVDLDGKVVKIRPMAEEDSEVVAVPLAQVSGVALYEPDNYGHYVGVMRDRVIPLFPEDAAEFANFSRYYALVQSSFSDGYQWLRVFALADVSEAVDNDGWLLGLERGFDVMVQRGDMIATTTQWVAE